jgi:hypothetical protein
LELQYRIQPELARAVSFCTGNAYRVKFHVVISEVSRCARLHIGTQSFHTKSGPNFYNSSVSRIQHPGAPAGSDSARS